MHISLLNQSMKKIITAMRFDLTLSFVFSIWGVVVALFISAIMREQQRAFALESKHEENKADWILHIPLWPPRYGSLWLLTHSACLMLNVDK